MERMKFFEDLTHSSDFAEIDFHFASRLLLHFPNLSHEAVSVFFLLMSSYRLGHLCLPLKEQEIRKFLLSFSLEREVSEQILHSVSRVKEHIPNQIVEDQPDGSNLSKPFVFWDDCLYFQKNWLYEEKIATHLKRLLKEESQEEQSFSFSSEGLREDQYAAIKKALSHNFCLITGGPGTGKTYTASHIIKHFLEAKAKVVLAAPTGKAALRLESSFAQLGLDPASLCFGTLHHILQIKSGKDLLKQGTFIDADLVLVDECSMIDAGLFSCLLSHIREGTRLILLGDEAQLSPVETGTVFADLIEYAKETKAPFHAQLVSAARFENKELLQIIDQIASSQEEEVLELIEPLEEKQIFSFFYEKMKRVLSIPEGDPIDFFEILDSYKILSCMRKGPFGVDAINEKIASYYFSQIPEGNLCVIPIMISRTDYSLDLMNGEVGILVRKKQPSMTKDVFALEDYALFRDQDKSFRKVQASLLPSFEYGYCISVHKSQGSEYEEVSLLVPKGSESFGKEVLYTAVTRSKKKIRLFGEKATVREIFRRSGKKFSGIVKRLYKEKG